VAVQEAELAKLRAMLELKREQVAALKVRPGIDGVLQQIGDREMLQAGQRMMPGATLAKVVQPTKLKAEIKIAETQARDLLLGQSATIDTHNGLVPGEVMRIDPAALNGTVTVDIMLTGPLPKGARPDMNVEGTILLERLQNVLYVGRPINGQPESTVGLFKVVNGGKEAIRLPVKLGRGSVNTIEIRAGLEIGDQVILSDMSQWDAQDRVRLN
jgi:HlyD family secretion protein